MRIQRINSKTSSWNPAEVDLALLDPLIEKYKHKKGNMIPLLQGTMDIYGYLPRGAFEKIASGTGLEVSDMFGVATFYAQFRLNPVGKHIIKVCHGTACHVQNANAITDSLQESLGIKDGETALIETEAGSVTVEAEIADSSHRGQVVIPHGFGLVHMEKVYGVNANQLTSAKNRDHIAATPLHRYIPCRVCKD